MIYMIYMFRTTGDRWRFFATTQKGGDAKSQYLIAESPGRHPGPQVEPMKWLRKAAEQGFAPAQFKLGAMYDGITWIKGEPRDAVQAVLLVSQGGGTRAY